MDLPFHVRALDRDGNTIRQLTIAFATATEAQTAADRANRSHDDHHVVCVSLDPKSPRNNTRDQLKTGFVVYDPNEEVDEVTAAAAARAELATMRAELAKAKAEAQIAQEDAKAALAAAAKVTTEKPGKPKVTTEKPGKPKVTTKAKKK